ncbi:sulfatase-like hydrolase/transferase [Psychrosphaera sp. B3R10]|uniref:sulfatase-like hydrolase/transferase n=1 Tax=unclassified Psychrosphaera TaxID=2641570 RepID=UPI001C08ABF7|nr:MULTISPECIES: sulfatase-like hydrolase/transferase [unclassified Psychrosphaera]MBU2881489.1 sulfatase-like hydrolase/transferase [Psychrosphaera sp. I2R16]MBU2989499.1 sulfatase-like hydrolase/transferase [Psychrosphaera sp. B3R10]
MIINKMIVIIIGALLLTIYSTSSVYAQKSKPNILFILTDDQSFDALGSVGNSLIKTPNLDKLAAKGMTLSHVYNQGSWSPAVCAPSRAMINTGRNLFETGMQNKQVPLDARPNYPLWGETFKNAGYETFMTGKWHVSRQALLRSFNVGKAVHESGMTYDHYNAVMLDINDSENGVSETYSSKKHTSELIADEAVNFLQKNNAIQDKPFLMYVAFLAPHDTRQSPNNFVEMYPEESISLPTSFKQQHHLDQGDFWIRDEKLLSIPRKENETKKFIGEYYAMITHLDEQIGRILDSLDSSPYADNTLIIFTSDHGLAVGRHGLLGKQNQYDHSVRAPFIIAGKDIPKGKTVKGNIYLNSIFPTTAELAGIEIPNTVQAQSFAPLLTGERDSMNKYIYGAYRHFQRMVRTDDFKYIYYPMINETQLFDLQNDPEELVNVATNPKYTKQLVEMQSKLKELMTKYNDPVVLDSPKRSYSEAGFNTDAWSPKYTEYH